MCKHIFIFAALVFMGQGCRMSAPDVVEVSGSANAFDRRVRDNGSATFRSWNGVAYRMDCDTELAFFPDGTVKMLEWGMGLGYYAGQYKLHPDGFVSVWFKDYQQEWPTMIIRSNGDSLSLAPFNAENGFMFGNRGGATTPATQASYWPFKMLSGNDEAEVLAEMKRDGADSDRR